MLQAIQDLVAIAKHLTHLLLIKLILQSESGFFNKPITLARFKMALSGQTMQGYTSSNIITTCLIAFISNTKLICFSIIL